jgi:Carboxypeptidase regulatory-like domain
MSRDDIQKLLGGYATGTLTPEEQQALFEAALSDQELFDALAHEEALREVLSDPSARAQLLASMDDAPAPWYQRWWRPAVVMASALLIVAGIKFWEDGREPQETRVAKVELPRFVPRAQTPSTPMLPPAPEVKRAATPYKQLLLPAMPPVAPPPAVPAVHVTLGALAAPAAAPPPLPRVSDTSLQTGDAFSVNGAISQGTPTPQQQQQQQPMQRAQQLGTGAVLPNALPMNRMFGSANVAVNGTVTDATGAAVPAATVSVKSVGNGEVVNATTDPKGQFMASGAPGDTVEVTASAPGYRSTTIRETTPASGLAAPVNLKLEVAAASQTVEVTAQATLQPNDALSAGLAGASVAEMKAKKVAPAPELPYHLLRRTSSGELIEVRAEETIPTGSALTLRATPGANGYLRIVVDGRTVANPKVTRNVLSETALPQFDTPGRVEVQVYFSRQAGEAKSQATGPAFTIAIHVQ